MITGAPLDKQPEQPDCKMHRASTIMWRRHYQYHKQIWYGKI